MELAVGSMAWRPNVMQDNMGVTIESARSHYASELNDVRMRIMP